MNSTIEIQRVLLEHVRELSNDRLVEVLREELNLSRDAAYRRMRGDKILTIDEVQKLCQVYNISFDELIAGGTGSAKVSFDFPFDNLNFDFKQYLLSIRDNLRNVQGAGGVVYFSAKDLPMFHCFQLEKLTKFKLYYWLKTMLSRKEMVGVKFSDFEVDEETLNICTEIYEAYSGLDSIEIWNYETIHGFTSQIAYFNTVGFINNRDTLALFDELRQLLEHLSNEAELEQKTHLNKRNIGSGGKFTLFYNEVLAADNSIYAEFGNVQATFIPSLILNYITTFDPKYCAYIKSVFESVMKKSTLISGVNEKDRSLFFNYNYKRLDNTINKL